ncbi:DNA polymerase lambda [Bienertia sinuspersici]
MAPKKKETSPQLASDGMFSGVFVYLVDVGVQPRRLQIWKQRLEQMGAQIEGNLSKRVTHILAMNWGALKQKVDTKRLSNFKGSILGYQWLEDSLRLGEKVSENSYLLKENSGENVSHPSSGEVSGHLNENSSLAEESPHHKKLRPSSPQNSKDSTTSPGVSRDSSAESKGTATSDEIHEDSFTSKSVDGLSSTSDSQAANYTVAGTPDKRGSTYDPPNLNKNITDIFRRLKDIYKALGDERRSFSYYKAIPVIEKLPFTIESGDQVKNLPGIGKSLRDHIQEIVSTGKLSKLEHFENDEKVKTIVLFWEIWGVGAATALALYEKGHRTLDDLKNEPSLSAAQKLGLQYYDDIKKRIPRHEVAEMEKILQNVGEEVLPGVVIVCGGSYRRGQSSCGDMDIIITHPDGKSHKGFLAKFVTRLKDMNFLREELRYSTHSEEVFPKSIYPFGLIHWTGNDTLNRRLRLLASSKGYRLDETGLFLSTPSSDSKRGSRGMTSMHFDTEKEVFDFLGYPYLEPNERNI